MSEPTPVWVWPPSQAEPVHAASLAPDGDLYRFTYQPGYMGGPKDARSGGVPLDPVQLRLKKGGGHVTQGLPGVIADAKPAGYGQDRLNARLSAQYQRDLTDMELLEEGPADGVGAIEVCHDIERKLAWHAAPISQLQDELGKLEDDAPASRAMRRANGDIGTSAGGERPKSTFVDQGRLWLVKMQDRGDRQGMPAMEFLTMTLASQAQVRTPTVQLRTVGPHQAFMVARFDRTGDPRKPLRHLFASAQTVLQLPLASVRGDPRRSYLQLADRMRVWCKGTPSLPEQHHELWRRMAFNAMVGNIDDHPRNHGLLLLDGHWQLAPAFDITPVWRNPQAGGRPSPALAMATGLDGSGAADAYRLLAAAPHFGLDPSQAAHYLLHTSEMIATCWEAQLREALAPLADARPADYTGQVIDDIRGAFDVSHQWAAAPAIIDQALDELQAPRRPGRGGRAP